MAMMLDGAPSSSQDFETSLSSSPSLTPAIHNGATFSTQHGTQRE
jgi:hypothetical protein